MNVWKFIDTKVSPSKRTEVRETIERITGKTRGAPLTKGNARPQLAGIDESQLRSLVRSIVREELSRRQKYNYRSVEIIEKATHWVWMENGEEWWLEDDDGNPNSTLESILSDFSDRGWRTIQVLEKNKAATMLETLTGKQYLVLLEKRR